VGRHPVLQTVLLRIQNCLLLGACVFFYCALGSAKDVLARKLGVVGWFSVEERARLPMAGVITRYDLSWGNLGNGGHTCGLLVRFEVLGSH